MNPITYLLRKVFVNIRQLLIFPLFIGSSFLFAFLIYVIERSKVLLITEWDSHALVDDEETNSACLHKHDFWGTLYYLNTVHTTIGRKFDYFLRDCFKNGDKFH